MPIARPSTLVPVLLAFAAVLITTTFFVGDTGIYSDDWFCNQRDPATGEVRDLVMNRPWHPYRPLTRLVLPPIITLLWNHPWALHAISAALHGAIIALTYGILRRFRVSTSIAAPTCLALMVYPAYFEVVLWNAAIGTLLSVIAMLLIWHLYLWWLTASWSDLHARDERVCWGGERIPWISISIQRWPEVACRKYPGIFRFAGLLLFSALTFASAALNEQAVGALLALPIAPSLLGLPAARTRTRRIFRATIPLVAIGLGGSTYILGFIHHLNSIDGRLTRDETEGLSGLAHRISEIARQVSGEMLLHDFASGAWSFGLSALAAHPVRTIIAALLLATLSVHWIQNNKQPITTTNLIPAIPTRWLLLAALGLIWTLGAWLPVAASYMVTWPRLHYVPAIGLAITCAAIASALAPLFHRLTTRRQSALILPLRLAFLIAIAAAIVLWIGLQSALQQRTLADAAEADPLVRTFATTVEPGTYFIPVRVNSTLPPTGARRFDDYFRHAWYWQFSSGWRLQSIMRSTDDGEGGGVYTFQTSTGVHLEMLPDNPSLGCIVHAPLPRPRLRRPVAGNTLPPNQTVIPWDRAIFFEITALGHTHIFTRVRLHPAGSEPIEITPRQITLSPAAASLPARTLDIHP